jgi:TolB-like protein
MERALAKALAPLPPDRYRSADEFARALRRATTPRGWLVGAMAVALVALLAAAGVLLQPRRGDRGTARRRVVVGAFENRTGDRTNDPFGIMAADWITEGLQRTGAVDVVPTATALAASRVAERGAPGADPIRILARETGAGLVVTGSLYRDRDSLILQAQLADASSGKLVGAVEPLRTTAESSISALQSLRDRLMGLLAISLDNRVQEAERPPTFDAYQAFAQGLAAYVRSDDSAAVVRFEAAHRLDSTFVLPILYASFCRSNLGDFAAADSLLRVVAPFRDRLNEYDRAWMDFRVAQLAGRDAQALAAIRRAAELAPTSKATYNFAVQAYEARQPVVAESALRSLSPDVGPMRGWLPYWTVLAMVLHVEGKHSQELEAGRQARSRFPGAIGGYVASARALAALGRDRDLDALWDEAMRVAGPPARDAGGLALETGSELAAHLHPAQAGRWFARALEAYTPAEGVSDTRALRWGRARALAKLGRWPEVDTLARRLTQQDSTREDYLGLAGLAAVRLRDGTRAYAILRRLASDRQPYLYGNAQFHAARIAAAAGDTLQATRLLASAYAQGYPYDIDFHRDEVLRRLAGTAILQRMSAR